VVKVGFDSGARAGGQVILRRQEMLVLSILLSRLRKHASHHLVIPLVTGIVFEGAVEAVNALRGHESFSLGFLLSLRMLYFVLGAFVTYVVIMFLLVNDELKSRINEKALKTLQHSLDDAKSYFGLSIISLREWFNPSMQVYLAKILNHKLKAGAEFEHQRALLFFSKAEYENATNRFMEEYYYGESLAHLHRDCGIPLACLERDDIFRVLSRLQEGEREALGCYPRWTKWGLCRHFRKLPLHRLRGRIRTLDLAVIEKRDGRTYVLCISKHGGNVDIHDTITDVKVGPYKELINKIEELIYFDKATKQLKPKHDFGANYHSQ
jgi:hypothetical protein